MAKKKDSGKQKEEKKEVKVEASTFDYRDYVEKTFTTPKAFIYYIIVNGLSFKNKKEVDEAYKSFKQLGGN